MARYTFGGVLTHLVTAVDSITGALRLAPGASVRFYSAPVGGEIVSDFLVDSTGNGTFDTAATSIRATAQSYLPDFQGPDGLAVLYYDPNVTDNDVRRVQLAARDFSAGGVPAATTTVAGVTTYATTAEADAGASTGDVMTPALVKRRVDAHNGDPAAHPELVNALDAFRLAVLRKADLDPATDTVPLDQLPSSGNATPFSLAERTASGALVATAASQPSEVVTLQQMQAAVGGGTGGAGTDVRYAPLTGTPSSGSTSAWATLAGAAVTNAKSGDIWQCDYSLYYRATTAGGIQIRHKLAAAQATNKVANSSFETDTSGWASLFASATIARSTTGGGQDGAANLTVTQVTTAASAQAVSDWVPTTPGTTWSAGAYAKLGAGTARQSRVDIQFGDATGATVTGGTFLGTAITPTTGAWTQAKRDTAASSAATAPEGTTQVRVRLVTTSPVAGESTRWDAIQLEQSALLPAYGSTGGSGSSALSIVGDWGPNLIPAAATRDDYRGVDAIRYPTVANLIAAAGGLGATTDARLVGSFRVTVGGTNLTGQRIELEFAQRVADATATQMVDGAATFALVGAAA